MCIFNFKILSGTYLVLIVLSLVVEVSSWKRDCTMEVLQCTPYLHSLFYRVHLFPSSGENETFGKYESNTR